MSNIDKYAVISGHGINLDKGLGEEIVDNNSSVINTDFGKTSAPIKEVIVGSKNIFFSFAAWSKKKYSSSFY